MSIFIACLAVALILGVPTVLAVTACMRSGQISREWE